MGAIQNAINQSLVLGGVAAAKVRSDAKQSAEIAREAVKEEKGEEFKEGKSKLYLRELESKGSIGQLKKYTKTANKYLSGEVTAEAQRALKAKKAAAEEKAEAQEYNKPMDYQPSSPEEQAEIEGGRLDAEFNVYTRMQQNNRKAQMKKEFKQYQYNLTRAKKGGKY